MKQSSREAFICRGTRDKRLSAQHWQTTAAEIAQTKPCDRLAGTNVRALTRAIDIAAPAAVTFRWLCQLRAAPYSYDWIDNLGRRSPRTLTPGLDKLALGQSFLVGTLAEFVVDQQITLRALPAAERLFGLVAMTYSVSAQSPGASRLVARLLVRRPGNAWEHARWHVLAWGDLVMMRKQFVTLKELAEEAAHEPVSEVGGSMDR
jgi:hypothetical protein